MTVSLGKCNANPAQKRRSAMNWPPSTQTFAAAIQKQYAKYDQQIKF